MKRLTIKQVAGANIRINRKAYTSLCAWGTIRGHEEQMAQSSSLFLIFICTTPLRSECPERSCIASSV